MLLVMVVKSQVPPLKYSWNLAWPNLTDKSFLLSAAERTWMSVDPPMDALAEPAAPVAARGAAVGKNA